MKLTRRAFWNSALATAACAIALPLFSGCGNNANTTATGNTTPVATSGGPSSETLKLGFIVKDPTEPWFQLEWKFADQAAKESVGSSNGFPTIAAAKSSSTICHVTPSTSR